MTQSHCKPLYPCCLLSYCVYCCHIWWPHRTCQNQPSSHASNTKGIFCQCQFTSKKDVMLNFWRDISAVLRKLSVRLFDASQACAVSAGFPSTSSSSVETLWCLACIDQSEIQFTRQGRNAPPERSCQVLTWRVLYQIRI